jgi:hypothetical protein
MSDTRVYARQADGTETDVTEGVQVLYDHMVSSMDWGSGFLTVEDAKGIIEIAQACGFEMPEDAAAQFENYARSSGTSAGNVICATCGEQVRWDDGLDWVNETGGPAFGPRRRAGWVHVDHDPGHPPRLWR